MRRLRIAELTTPVRGVLPGTDAPLSGIGQIGYGVAVGSTGATEDWLVEGGTQGGIWTVTTGGVWSRRSDLDTPSDFNNMPSVRVREGNQGVGGSVWYYEDAQNPTFDVDDLSWRLGAFGEPALDGTGLEYNPPYLELPERADAQGSHALGIFTQEVSSRGVIEDFELGPAGEMFIHGMTLSVPSAAFIDVTQGAAYVPSRGNMASQGYTGDSLYLLEDEPLGIASGKLYYLYVSHYGEPVSPFYYLSPVAPVSDNLIGPPYVKGPAGSEDRSRRYLGTLRSASISSFYKQSTEGVGSSLTVSYLENINASPFLVISAGTATSAQTVNLGPSGLKLVPPTCRMVYLKADVSATASATFSNSEAVTLTSTTYLRRVGTVQRGDYFWLPLDASQSFTWLNNTGGGSTDVHVLGYMDRR